MVGHRVPFMPSIAIIVESPFPFLFPTFCGGSTGVRTPRGLVCPRGTQIVAHPVMKPALHIIQAHAEPALRLTIRVR